MGLDSFERALLSMPALNRLYWDRAGRLRRRFCLLLDRFALLRPVTFVQWLATYGCNCRCAYCEASAGKPRPGELTADEVRAFLDDIAGMGVKRLLISGGEPLTRPDIVELMDYANRRGLLLGLVTNGYLVERLWRDLRRFRYFLYFTSLDGPADAHDAARGRVGAWEQAVRALGLMREKGVAVRIANTVVPPGKVKDLSLLFPVIRQSGATHWRLSPITRVGLAAGKEEYDPNGGELKALVDFARDANRVFPTDLGCSCAYLKHLAGLRFGKPFFCGAGLTRCSVLPTGEVLGCQLAYNPALAEGNVREKPLSLIWREGFQRFRKPAPEGSCATCAARGACLGGCWAEMETCGSCLKLQWEGSPAVR